MKFEYIRLGKYIKRSAINNKDEKYGTELIVGVNNEGIFTSPKGDPKGVNLKPYKIVNNGAFVYNPSRLDLSSIAYRTEGLCIVSHLYIVLFKRRSGLTRCFCICILDETSSTEKLDSETSEVSVLSLILMI